MVCVCACVCVWVCDMFIVYMYIWDICTYIIIYLEYIEILSVFSWNDLKWFHCMKCMVFYRTGCFMYDDYNMVWDYGWCVRLIVMSCDTKMLESIWKYQTASFALASKESFELWTSLNHKANVDSSRNLIKFDHAGVHFPFTITTWNRDVSKRVGASTLRVVSPPFNDLTLGSQTSTKRGGKKWCWDDNVINQV